MKILQVCPFLAQSPLDTASGVSAAAFHVSNELAKHGHDVTLCASAKKNTKKNSEMTSETFENITIIRFPYRLSYYTFFVTPSFVPFLRENLMDFDIVHIHDLRHFQALAAHHYATQYDIPYVLQAHGAALPFGKRTVASFLFDVTWGRRLVKDADLFLALTDTEVDQYESIGAAEHKIKILSNGVDLSEFVNLPTKGDFRRKYKINQNEQIILFLSRIHKIKGLDLLLDAFDLLTRELDNVTLVIAGPDDDGSASSLQLRANQLGLRDRVLFVGPLYQRDKLEAYVDADVYVLTSRYETFPLTVLEAWACGTPVIVTDRCGIAEYAKKAGCVVKFDTFELCKALSRVLKNRDWRERASKLGRELVRREFSWDRVIDQLEAFYSELRKNNKQRGRSTI